jgi:transposase
MPSALSFDLRSRIVSACQTAELTQSEIAELFQVHLKTVEKLWQQFRRTGSVQAKPHRGGIPARLAGWEQNVRRLVSEQSDHTLAEYVSLLWERRYQVVTSVPVLSRTLKAWGLPQKKSRSRQWNASARKRSGRGGAFKPN